MEMELVSTNSERIILVIGATGQQWGAVYRHLQKKGFISCVHSKVQGIAGLRPSSAQPSGEVITELQAPMPDAWMPHSARISSTSRKLRPNT
jgi:hypothetical protein